MFNIIRGVPLVGYDGRKRQSMLFMQGNGAEAARPCCLLVPPAWRLLPAAGPTNSPAACPPPLTLSPSVTSSLPLPPAGQLGAEGFIMGSLYTTVGLAVAALVILAPRVRPSLLALGWVAG